MSAEKLDLIEACAVLAVHQDWRTGFDDDAPMLRPVDISEALCLVIDAAPKLAKAIQQLQARGVTLDTWALGLEALRTARLLPERTPGGAP